MTVREEGIGNYLGCLPSCYIVVGAEVWPVRVIALLALAPTRVTTDHASLRQAVDPDEERTISGHIAELMCTRGFVEPGSLRDNLA